MKPLEPLGYDLALFLKLLVGGDDERPLDVLDDLDEIECVEEGDWTTDGKYQARTNIYKHLPTGRFVAVHDSRSGSYYSDYEYIYPLLNEVFPETVTQIIYKAKK